MVTKFDLWVLFFCNQSQLVFNGIMLSMYLMLYYVFNVCRAFIGIWLGNVVVAHLQLALSARLVVYPQSAVHLHEAAVTTQLQIMVIKLYCLLNRTPLLKIKSIKTLKSYREVL